MSLSKEQIDQLDQLIQLSLDAAKGIWGQVEPLLVQRQLAEAIKSISSQIPGYPTVARFSPQVDRFIAMMADMRDSTKHLMQAISGRITQVNQLQRIFYETSALLPAMALAISFENGNVTEYLGDGVLALFRVPDEQMEETIYAAHRAAQSCLSEVRDLVNDEIGNRYNLPPLDLGVGLAMSKAIVTVVGTENFEQPKAIGECVYRATKLSNGRNEILVDEAVYNAWPRSENGVLRFRGRQYGDVNGYVIERKN